MKNDHWMEDAKEDMKRKGTLGSFGKATPTKIAKAKKLGGKISQKAGFARTAKKIAAKRRRKRGAKRI